MEISFNTDSDGFLSQECPACKRRFKVQFTQDASGKSLTFCPYCGHSGEDCWWTQEQADYVAASLQKEVVPEIKKMARNLERMNRPGGAVQFKANRSLRPGALPPAPKESDDPWPKATFSCCDEVIKHDGSVRQFHCIICGKETSV